jgi:hypothetical protein
LFELLGADPDQEVRLAVASRADCPLVVLQELEQDEHPDVRAAAAAGMSSAFRPRALHGAGADGLFTRAELDALGQDADASGPLEPPPLEPPALDPPALGQDGPAGPVDPPSLGPFVRATDADGLGVERAAVSRRRRRQFAPGGDDELLSGIDDILRRLDAVTSRLGALENVLGAAGDRLSAISERLDGLGAGALANPPGVGAALLGDPPGVAAGPSPIAAPPENPPLPVAAEASLLPVVHPAELASGPVIRADIVAAAWLAVLPLLARQRGRGQRAPAVAVPVPTEAVAGPFTATTAVAVAELLPGPPARTTVADSSERRAARALRRHHTGLSRRRGSRR